MPDGTRRARFERKKVSGRCEGGSQTIFASSEGDKIRASTVTSLRQVLEAAGVEFTDGRKPGVRVNLR